MLVLSVSRVNGIVKEGGEEVAKGKARSWGSHTWLPEAFRLTVGAVSLRHSRCGALRKLGVGVKEVGSGIELLKLG